MSTALPAAAARAAAVSTAFAVGHEGEHITAFVGLNARTLRVAPALLLLGHPKQGCSRVVWVQLLGCYAVGVIIRFKRAQICRGNGSGSREHCKRVARVGNSAQACRAPVPQS